MTTYVPANVRGVEPTVVEREVRVGDVIRLEALGAPLVQATVTGLTVGHVHVRVTGEPRDRQLVRGWARWRLWQQPGRYYEVLVR